ncbi:ATP-binding protein [Niallia endozanthoxylica]|uniref:histidine kinase n=1 Tax=Niallia endozanthoxylica TaxID=2036016 RepID=A0A5J5I7K2_9BACI|nr:ATP-binding protein [Niallia endozanthoxylica]KAA9032413.1 two-component sensor histidine kinase [Niallia endozanthoxylica]
MDLYTKNLIISFLSVLFPLFVWQLFYLLHYNYQFKWVKKWMFAIFPILSIVLCMTFPIALMQPLFLDFRRIPLILGTLYGGYKVGFVLLAVMFITRYLMGGDVFYTSSIILILTTICAGLLSDYYLKKSLKQKVVLNSVLILLSLVFSALFMNIFGTNLLKIGIEHWFISVIGMVIATLLTEIILINFHLLHKSIKEKKLDVASHLAASFSHEIGNPLTATKGFIQLLSDEKISIETRNQYLKIAEQELDQAINIIDDYLTFANPAPKGKEKIWIPEAIQQGMAVLAPVAEENKVKVSTSFLENNDCFVLGERKKMEQCLIYILKNRIESMPSGGEIRITLDDDGISNVNITIQDEGIGMTQRQIDQLGEPFFTTKENGTGLGMMVAFRIIKGIGGKIEVKSVQGNGTLFHISLPKYDEKTKLIRMLS